jgi:hypothetical protein
MISLKWQFVFKMNWKSLEKIKNYGAQKKKLNKTLAPIILSILHKNIFPLKREWQHNVMLINIQVSMVSYCLFKKVSEHFVLIKSVQMPV